MDCTVSWTACGFPAGAFLDFARDIMLIGASLFLRYCGLFRVCVAAGRYGSGKSLLAVAVADVFLRSGWSSRVVANMPHSWANEAEDVIECEWSDLDFADTFFIYDEAFDTLGEGASFKHVRSYLAYLRKRRSVLFCASVLPLARAVRRFSVERIFNAQIVGLPLWLYRWHLSGTGFKDSGKFALWYPRKYYGMYEHTHIPDGRWWIGKECG